MQIFPAPTNLKELTNNIRSVITDKRSLLLGKECEVIPGQTSISNAPIQKISAIFENLITREQQTSELIEFQSILTVFDRMLTISNFQLPKIDSYVFFGPLIEKVQQGYESMPLSKTLPATADLIAQYETRAQRSAKETYSFSESSQNILTLLQLERVHYDLFSSYTYFAVNASLGDKVLPLIEQPDRSNGYSTSVKDFILKKSDFIEISQINLGFALLFYDIVHNNNKNPDTIESLCIDISILNEKQHLDLIDKITEFLSEENFFNTDQIDVLKFIRRNLLRNILRMSDVKQFGKIKTKLKEIISSKKRDLFLTITPGNSFKKELSFSSLNDTFFSHLSKDPSGLASHDIDYLLSLHGPITTIEFSFNYLKKLYRLVHLELFKTPENLQKQEKLSLYKSQRSIYDAQKFEDPSEFCKSILSDKIPLIEDIDVSSSSTTSSNSDWLPPQPKPPKPQNKKKSPPKPIVSCSTDHQLVAQTTPLSATPTQTVQSNPDLYQAPSAIPYDERVHDWRINPDKMLSLPSFSSKSARSKEQSRIFHAFALEVDKYVFSHGIKSLWSNQKRNKEDLHFSIPGEITVNTEIKRGIFTYCFDEDNICYHRCFTEKTSGDAMREYIEKGFWDVDFPPLEASKEKEQIFRSEQIADDGSFLSKQINSYTLEIADPRNHATIRLFQIKST